MMDLGPPPPPHLGTECGPYREGVDFYIAKKGGNIEIDCDKWGIRERTFATNGDRGTHCGQR